MSGEIRFRQLIIRLAGGALLAGLAALPVAAQGQSQEAKPANCSTYKLDEKTNRITFKDTRVFVLLPEKQERDTLRTQGTPGQLFRMKNCDTPDLEAELDVFNEADRPGDKPAEKVPSAVRVVILAEKEKWIQVKGHTSLWKGTGWIRVDDKTLVVRY